MLDLEFVKKGVEVYANAQQEAHVKKQRPKKTRKKHQPRSLKKKPKSTRKSSHGAKASAKLGAPIIVKQVDGERPELAFYYPNPIWMNGDWIKNLVLFFDGIALLVPKYMKGRIEEFDPAIVAGLKQHDLLHVVEPERAVDKSASATLASMMTDIITSGALDFLVKDSTAFHELSMSRLGYYGDERLADMIFKELKKRGLARRSRMVFQFPCTQWSGR